MTIIRIDPGELQEMGAVLGAASAALADARIALGGCCCGAPLSVNGATFLSLAHLTSGGTSQDA